MKRVPMVNTDACAMVDNEDYALVAGITWGCSRKARGRRFHFYAYQTGSSPIRTMQGLIMGPPPPGMVVDHRNGNGLDNRRKNLRFATPSQNAQNACKKRAAPSSRFKGVSKSKRRWKAVIVAAGRVVYLGSFPSEAEAALAYDAAARVHHGEFACVNFPQPGERGALV